MSKILHILNGDSTLSIFQKSGIEGDTFVWREVLSDGPVHPAFGSKDFWDLRNSFMSASFKLKQNEYSKEVKEIYLNTVKHLDSYDEIVLWFEYDLFCQVNMMALIHWMNIEKPNGFVSLVCSGKLDDSGKLYGLGEIGSSHYKNLFESRLKLGAREYSYASDFYEAYSSTEPDDLYTFILVPFEEFQYLPAALESHFKRFPYSETGLTEIEQQMVSFIKEGESDKNRLIGKMLRWQTHYGFGDLQYINILERMHSLFQDFDDLVLKPDLNKSVVESLIDRNYILGGAKVKDWYWDENEKTLTSKKSTS